MIDRRVEVPVDPIGDARQADQDNHEELKQNSQDSFHWVDSRTKQLVELTQNARGLLPTVDKVAEDNRRGLTIDEGR